MESTDTFDALRRGGFRLTAPRLRAAELFADAGRWMSPQELHREAAGQGVDVGLTTVYRLLEAMTAVGLARRFAQDGRAYRYVYCHPSHHHHLICRSCGRVEDVDECLVKAPRHGTFHVESHVLDFFGLCDQCYQKMPEPGRHSSGHHGSGKGEPS
ncbi:MAG: Fur family transcriptional regulator [Bacillota bacterium]